ncbi:hypothetical protein VBK20_25520 [Enterobacter hormaechei]|nr:hypothetical protein [Enterobacter hormaechei]
MKNPTNLFIFSLINCLIQVFMVISCFNGNNGFSYAWTTSGVGPMFMFIGAMTCWSSWKKMKIRQQATRSS